MNETKTAAPGPLSDIRSADEAYRQERLENTVRKCALACENGHGTAPLVLAIAEKFEAYNVSHRQLPESHGRQRRL